MSWYWIDCPRRPIYQETKYQLVTIKTRQVRHAHPATYGRVGVVQGMKGTRLRLHAMELQARIVQTQPMKLSLTLSAMHLDALLSPNGDEQATDSTCRSFTQGSASSRECLVFHAREFSSVAYGYYGALSCLATFLSLPLCSIFTCFCRWNYTTGP